jgi:hypothetical protein
MTKLRLDREYELREMERQLMNRFTLFSASFSFLSSNILLPPPLDKPVEQLCAV